MLAMIINPIAGAGKALRAGKLLQETLTARGIPFTAYQTERVGHATEIARACVAAGCDRVLSVGGDGTSLEVANGLVGSATALGIVPAGTGNDFVRTLGVPKDPIAALDTLLNAVPRRINICQVNDRISLNESGTGFDVDTSDYADKRFKKRGMTGMLPYLLAVLHTIFTNVPQRLRLGLDDETQDRDVLMLAVCNGQYMGGGMHIAPMARLDDDLLDVLIIKPVPRWRIPLLLPRFITGSIVKLTRIVEHRRCRNVSMAAPGMRVQVDGCIFAADEVRISISDQVLWMLAPNAD
jgi:YegS/Rv2252/BmrU family lipid kinase